MEIEGIDKSAAFEIDKRESPEASLDEQVDELQKRFESLLEEDRTKKRDEESLAGKYSPSEDMASAILKSLFHEIKSEAKVNSTHVSSDKKLVEVASEIAEKILVSEKKADGSQEIRILLKDSVLPQTEVRVFKEGDIVHIAFHTSSSEAQKVLMDNRESLNNYLHQQLGDKVRVEINFFSSQTEANTEGRSRGRRFVYEEIEG